MLVNFQGLLTVLVAAACIFAVGVTSSGLDSVETDPSDVLPEELIINPNDPMSSTSSSSSPEPSDDGKPQDVSLDQIQGAPQEAMEGARGAMETMAPGGSGSPTDWLPYILAVLVGVVAMVVAFYFARKKFVEEVIEDNGEVLKDIDTSNEVYKAWWEMVDMSDVDEIQTKTPQEIADELLEKNGTDPDAVVELTDVFEEVYYSEKRVTPDEEKRAREALERIKSKKGKML